MAETSHVRTTLRTALGVSWRLLGVVWCEDKWMFIQGGVGALLPGIIPFVNAYIYAQIINFIVSALSGHEIPLIHLYVLVAVRVMLLFVQSLAYILQRRGFMLINTNVPLFFMRRVTDKLATLDIGLLEDSAFQDKFQDAKETASWRCGNMVQNLWYAMQGIVQLLIAAVSLLFLNWIFALIVTLTAIPGFIYQLRSAQAFWNIWATGSPYRKRFSYLYYSIQNHRTVKELRPYGLAPYFGRQMKQISEDFAHDNVGVLNQHLLFGGLSSLADIAGYALVEVYLLLSVLARRASLGSLTYYTTALSSYQNGLGGLLRTTSGLLDEAQYVQDVFAVLDMQPTIVSPPDAVVLKRHGAPRIEFRKVDFAYPGSDKKILDSFSLVIEPGEKVAFVGENGAGKTTVIKLLCRFYDVTSGEILIDGVNIKDLDLSSWYQRLGVLFQDFMHYEETLRDNIHFGRIDQPATAHTIAVAATQGGADDVAAGFAKGYDQMLGKTFESGVELSGGQWQKVALSKAFYRNAPVLVLDEPTSAIDARAEQEIFHRVEKLATDKTVLIISHRFSTVRNADMIYVMEQGKITESGSHQQLMKQHGIYAELFNLQAKAYR